MFEYDALLNAFITLFVTIDPIGLAPLFLGLTDGMTRGQRFSVGLRASIIAFCLLALFLFAGNAILDKLGITIHAFRVAGGLLLFSIAFEMVFGRRQERKEKSSKESITKDDIANVAVFPLALPLIAGPGAISAAILLSTQEGGTFEWRMVLTLIIFGIVLLTLLSFIAAGAIDRFLGYTGRMILTRLLGVLLAALSVQFVVDGLKALWGI
ncbi:MAG: MarC family protein [Rhizobiaceae bacterium]